jgi:hypothetical protein
MSSIGSVPSLDDEDEEELEDDIVDGSEFKDCVDAFGIVNGGELNDDNMAVGADDEVEDVDVVA